MPLAIKYNVVCLIIYVCDLLHLNEIAEKGLSIGSWMMISGVMYLQSTTFSYLGCDDAVCLLKMNKSITVQTITRCTIKT